MISQGLTRKQANTLYLEVLKDNDTQCLRQLCQEDLFFLLTIGFKREDINCDWLYERCREVEADPNEHIDLWAREHYKSTIITYGHSIKDILCNPNITIGIFSHTRPIAKAFLSQIKFELERNIFLKTLFPEILYESPKSEAPLWSLDSGIMVKRTNNSKEATVQAWGVVDGQPTSKHFDILVYDDVVTRESVSTPEQIKKTTEMLQLSYNLGTKTGVRRFIGTRYHTNDTYKTIIDLGTAKPRLKPATEDGTIEGKSVFLPDDILKKKRRDMGPYVFGSQMLQNPVSDKSMGFKPEWLKYYNKINTTNGWNVYILVDPASEKKKTSDYTVMAVIGLAPDNNFYLLDAIRDRLNLTERTDTLFRLHRKWMPKDVGYEKYGLQSDIEHIEYVQEQENYRFNITHLGGQIKKEDRIKRLIPIFEKGRFWLPKSLRFTNYEGKSVDFVKEFIKDEYETFPVSTHDDMLDCISRILDQDFSIKFPRLVKDEDKKAKAPIDYSRFGSSGWMA